MIAITFITKTKITGLMCRVKVNQGTKDSYTRALGVKLTKEDGFTILLDCKATNYIAQPYIIYFLAQGEGLIEDPVIVDTKTFMKYSEFFIDAISYGAESEWLLDK